MEDLVRWLSACLDEDDEEARRGYLKAEPIPDYDGWNQSTTAGLPPAVAARVLREIDSKRQLLAEYKLANAEGKYPDWAGGYASGLEYAVQLAAAEYADRPGYDPEWAPRSQWGPPEQP
ncbi:DUF6221 family protein [Streptomyces caniscabiei]|uniref:DUF6221 family protein n=1 Tax=Streptomyces caniscabiei TaxID=2746961 RepID=UPI0029AC5203|nr:DUF6221 family protein [Streptomyces caniscabiei]MDX2954578.1 DUF6221 family protein [Streptomyces caniscabiei]